MFYGHASNTNNLKGISYTKIHEKPIRTANCEGAGERGSGGVSSNSVIAKRADFVVGTKRILGGHPHRVKYPAGLGKRV